jgi:hypothetical protein
MLAVATRLAANIIKAIVNQMTAKTKNDRRDYHKNALVLVSISTGIIFI